LTAGSPDCGHVRAITAHYLASLSTRGARFISGKFVRAALSVRCPPAFACDLALLCCIHRGKPPVALRSLGAILRSHL
jgi:hypothetical protein